MTNIFEWNPTLDQTYDADFTNNTLTTENTNNGLFPVNGFYKKDSDFTLVVDDNTNVTLAVDPNIPEISNHINWSSEVYGKAINVVKGTLTCLGTPQESNVTGTANLLLNGLSNNCLSLNVDGSLYFISYNNNVLEGVNAHVRNSGILKFINSEYISIRGSEDIYDTSAAAFIDDDASFVAEAKTSVFVHNYHFIASSNSDRSLFIKSLNGSIEFTNYDSEGTRGIKLLKNAKAHIQSANFKLNHAKVYAHRDSYLTIKTDNLVVNDGGRFTLTDKGVISLEGASKKAFTFTGSIAASYPQKLFSFSTSPGLVDGYYKFYGLDSGAGLNLLLSYGLLSVDGVTTEQYLRDVLYFQDLMDGSNKYLKIGMKNL